MMKAVGNWLVDYVHAARGGLLMVRHKNPPAHYLGHIVPGRSPVIFLPGVFNRWGFLKPLLDPISLMGHPVYVIPQLGYNLKSIPESAHIVRTLIEERNLDDVVLLGHSKGGLIGRHLISYHDKDNRVRKLIAIAAPFAGSKIVRALFSKALRELDPESEIIREMHAASHANAKIVSIYTEADNHVWPRESAVLEGAKNIKVPARGHHEIALNPAVRDIIVRELES